MGHLHLFIVCICTFFGVFVKGEVAADASPACYRMMQTSFFHENSVAQALALQNIDQNLWIFIARDLKAASARIPAIVQAQARSIVPNPLNRPFDPARALKILEAALYSVYYPILDSYKLKTSYTNINNSTIYGSFRYLWLQQQAYLVRCLGIG